MFSVNLNPAHARKVRLGVPATAEFRDGVVQGTPDIRARCASAVRPGGEGELRRECARMPWLHERCRLVESLASRSSPHALCQLVQATNRWPEAAWCRCRSNGATVSAAMMSDHMERPTIACSDAGYAAGGIGSQLHRSGPRSPSAVDDKRNGSIGTRVRIHLVERGTGVLKHVKFVEDDVGLRQLGGHGLRYGRCMSVRASIRPCSAAARSVVKSVRAVSSLRSWRSPITSPCTMSERTVAEELPSERSAPRRRVKDALHSVNHARKPR